MHRESHVSMLSSEDVPPVADNELLARFMVNNNDGRADGTVRPSLFIPWSYTEISVNRHRDSNLQELWEVGEAVALERAKQLYGIANIRASACRGISPLDVVAAPVPANPNHADICGFPGEKKEDQLAFGQKLAASIEGQWLKRP